MSKLMLERSCSESSLFLKLIDKDSSEAVFWKLDLVDKADEDEVVKVLCLELLLKAACSSLSCFAEADSAKRFVQDDHGKDQANKFYWPLASQARVPN